MTELKLMQARHNTNKVLNNMRRNRPAEAYLRKRRKDKLFKRLAIATGLILSVSLLTFIYF